MMFDSVLVKVSCSEELLYLHTISRRHKSPYRFAILRDTLEQLEREPGRQVIVADCGCYAALRLTRALDGEMLEIRFSWLQSAGADSLRGYEEWVRLPYRRFHECVEAGTDMAGWNWSQLSVPEKVTRRFEFHSRRNLHQIAQRPLLRHKLGKTLEHHFQWRGAEKILIYDDGAPYSFFFEEVTPRARESAAASSCMARIICRKPSTASTPNYNREVHIMTIIKINGGFWGWEPIETLERLYPLFEQYTLDPIYEWHGNFVNRKPEWQRSEERQAYQGCTVISGQFLNYGNFFYIVTDEEELIQHFERLVAANKATKAYQDERKVCFPCSECNQWSAASGLCGLTGRYRQPQWECFARYVLPKGKVEGEGANMRIELPIPEKAGKKAVLTGRGKWEV